MPSPAIFTTLSDILWTVRAKERRNGEFLSWLNPLPTLECMLRFSKLYNVASHPGRIAKCASVVSTTRRTRLSCLTA